jgi:hypothetical protein
VAAWLAFNAVYFCRAWLFQRAMRRAIYGFTPAAYEAAMEANAMAAATTQAHPVTGYPSEQLGPGMRRMRVAPPHRFLPWRVL